MVQLAFAVLNFPQSQTDSNMDNKTTQVYLK